MVRRQQITPNPKLNHILRKLVENQPNEKEITTELIYNELLIQHKEYKRHNTEQLNSSIEIALRDIQSSPNPNKRLREDDIETREEGHNLLNSSLRDRYSKLNTNKEDSTNSKSKKKKKKKIIKEEVEEEEVAPPKKSWNIIPTPHPKQRYEDMGGIDTVLSQIREFIEYPLLHSEYFLHLGISPPNGVLFTGPTGCGKTHLAHAIAGELILSQANISFLNVSGPELIGGLSGESETRIRTVFDTAKKLSPCIIFLDEIDAILSKRGGGSSNMMEKRMVAQFLSCMDELSHTSDRVMVVAATNRPESIDASLRRAGRFEKEIVLNIPDVMGRQSILQKITQSMTLDENLDFVYLAKNIPGYVGADIVSLCREAAILAIHRFKQGNDDCNDMEGKLFITNDDFLKAIPKVQPSSKREGFATVPDVTWDNIGALDNVREELALTIIQPISHPERFLALGLPLPAGVLLYGPPGCGKTLLAKAIANQSNANFISVKGPELLDKYVGESERAVRVVFDRARSSQPCVIFFDELDSLCPKRGSSSEGGVSERVVNQLLTEMDGMESRKGVFIIAATNRPELIDPAMMRPGRLDKLLYVPLPTPEDRVSILQTLAVKVNLAPDVNLETIARSPKADGFSGADCAALLREAGLAVLRDDHKKLSSSDKLQITTKHLEYALDHVIPSVSKHDRKSYDSIQKRMGRVRPKGKVSRDMDLDVLVDGKKIEKDGLGKKIEKDGAVLN